MNSNDLAFSRGEYIATVVAAFSWGFHAALFQIAIYTLFTTKGGWRNQYCQIIYVTLLSTSATAYMVCALAWGYQEIIKNALYPGGPMQFYEEHFNSTFPLLGDIFFSTTNFLADSLLLWRTWVVWNRNWTAIVTPALVLVASTVMAILSLYQSAQPDTPLFSSTSLPMIVPYFSLSITLNLVLTLMIVAKLLLAQRNIGGEYGKAYVGVVAIVVESAALYAASSIVFIATYAADLGAVFTVFLPLQVHMMCISPLLIIIRVAKGRSITERAATSTATSVSFAAASNEEQHVDPPAESSRRARSAGATEIETKIDYVA